YENDRKFILNKSSKFRYDLFISGDIFNQTQKLKGLQEVRANSLSIELSGGGRFGIYPSGVFIFGGYSRRFSLQENLFVNLKENKEFEVATISKSNIFLGLSIRNAINFRVLVTPSIKTLKKSEPILDKLSFSIGFGI
ncbi:MAG: hypothetical protein IT258_13705, partial [Saprospiraceae bacterium]|nr:hypothetical protein [Saprospiraceae bacterium]